MTNAQLKKTNDNLLRKLAFLNVEHIKTKWENIESINFMLLDTTNQNFKDTKGKFGKLKFNNGSAIFQEPNGKFIYTSAIVKITKGKDILTIETLNSVYKFSFWRNKKRDEPVENDVIKQIHDDVSSFKQNQLNLAFSISSLQDNISKLIDEMKDLQKQKVTKNKIF